jgi:hypothetical protein
MKRILVPTDFSEHAEYALRVAAVQIAKKNEKYFTPPTRTTSSIA